ncbi:hypothetical protein SY89_02693 [Halolamina pelagica]|uniref:Uncharacterized protein n=1 Tax=Halolamina pelagica TaxID=699431 RepID=A0A0P7GD10_9EURY|nr:hypothetical protein [Halolamina pelagica]KPN31936.1 hypothetical protein SY89_02693 [Halolamina pelagica]
MVDLPDIEWPDDLRCGVCGAVVGDKGLKIHVARLVIPREPELYAWCEEHKPVSEEEEKGELFTRVRRGDFLEQAQSWDDYD